MSQLDGLWRRGKKFLGSEVPVIAEAMTWISDARSSRPFERRGVRIPGRGTWSPPPRRRCGTGPDGPPFAVN
jgi:hypothetical protein